MSNVHRQSRASRYDVPVNSGSQHSEALRQVAAQLAALGSETAAQRRVKSILPWVISIAAHVGIFAAAAFITWTVTNRPSNDDAVLIVADFNALQYAPVVTMPVEHSEQPLSNTPLPLASVPPLPASKEILNQLRPSEADLAPAPDDLGRSAEAAAASLAQFTPRMDPTAASFAGTTASNARKVVYVIDATGSMVAHLQTVLRELERSLANLSRQQSFAVILFQKDQVLARAPLRLTPATAAERDRTVKWIQETVAAQGSTDPLPALKRAMQLQPDVIFLLSHGLTGHGEYEIDQRELLAELDRLNPKDAASGRRPVQINCIQYIKHDPLDTMRRIAEAHGGANGFKFLSAQELGLQER